LIWGSFFYGYLIALFAVVDSCRQIQCALIQASTVALVNFISWFTTVRQAAASITGIKKGTVLNSKENRE
jgi:hypothetical protein